MTPAFTTKCLVRTCSPNKDGGALQDKGFGHAK